MRYEVRKHFKDNEGFMDYETLFTGDNQIDADNFRSKLPKDNKKVQYTSKRYFTVTITSDDAKEYDRIHKKIWDNMTDDSFSSVL